MAITEILSGLRAGLLRDEPFTMLPQAFLLSAKTQAVSDETLRFVGKQIKSMSCEK